MNPLMMCTKAALDNIVLCPKISLSLSHHNKKTGSASGTRSFALSATISLWNLMLWMIGIGMAMKLFWWLWKKKECRKIRKKLRKRAQKMSKS